MSEEVKQDETEGFVVTSSDLPEVQPESQEEQKKTDEANPEEDATEEDGKDSDKEADDKSGDDAAAEQDKAKKPNRVQKRIDQVVREREDERRKNEALQREIDELKKGKSENQDKPTKEPVESDFDTYDEYLDALDKFDNDQAESDDKSDKKDDKKGDEDQEAQAELTESQKTAMAIIKEQVESADKPEDFESVALNPEVPITGDMLEALAECDDPTKVMYHLGQNKDLAAKIAESSPAQQMREIAKLDLTVDSKPPKPTKTTQAPDPITPVKGSDSQQKNPADMSQSEYEAWANKRERERKSW